MIIRPYRNPDNSAIVVSGLLSQVVPFLAGKTHPGQALGVGEYDAAVLIIPGVCLVLAHDRELDPVDGFQLLHGQAQSHGRKHIDLHQRLATGIVCAQGAVPVPLLRQVAEKGVGQAGIGLGPGVGGEGVMPAGGPEGGVLGGEACESQNT